VEVGLSSGLNAYIFLHTQSVPGECSKNECRASGMNVGSWLDPVCVLNELRHVEFEIGVVVIQVSINIESSFAPSTIVK